MGDHESDYIIRVEKYLPDLFPESQHGDEQPVTTPTQLSTFPTQKSDQGVGAYMDWLKQRNDQQKEDIAQYDQTDPFVKSLKEQIDDQSKVLTKKMEVIAANYAGGGSVAVQYANGGVMNGDLYVKGTISADNWGIDLSSTTTTLYDNLSVIDTLSVGSLSGFGSDTILPASPEIELGTVLEPFNVIHTQAVNLATTDLPAYQEGTLFYDEQDKTLGFYTNIEGVTLQIGQEQWVRVVNKTGSLIPNGTVVYISGSQGNRPTIELATSEFVELSCSRVIGFTTHNIEDNHEGIVTTYGIIRDLNTSAFNEGDPLYLNTIPGTYSNIPATQPANQVFLGYVLRSHNTQGSILVNIDSGCKLTALNDVKTSKPLSAFQGGEVLAYNTQLSAWQETIPASPASDIAFVTFDASLENKVTLVSCVSSDVNILLPELITDSVIIKRIDDNSLYTVFINAPVGQLVEFETSFSLLKRGESITLVQYDTNFYLI